MASLGKQILMYRHVKRGLDLLFSFVGIVLLAPVLVLDDQYHGNLTVETAVELLRKTLAADEVAKAAEAAQRLFARLENIT